jgi:hypothetical protein
MPEELHQKQFKTSAGAYCCSEQAMYVGKQNVIDLPTYYLHQTSMKGVTQDL